MVLPGIEFFVVVFALFKLGAVLVGVDPGMGIRNLGRCLAEAEPAVFIGNRKAHLARMLLRWSRRTLQLLISTEQVPLLFGMTRLTQVIIRGSSQPLEQAVAGGDDMAAILFTSGSTGPPKGAVYSHTNFYAQVHAIQQAFNIQPGERDMGTFPLFALFAPVMGMTAIIPCMDFTRPGSVDPQRLVATVNRYAATTMFGSPALLDRLGRWGAGKPERMPSLRRVLSAGAPVAPSILQRFSGLLPGDTPIFTPYGATEALPVSAISSQEILAETAALTANGKGVCIGRPVAGLQAWIIRITDTAIPEWEEGLQLPVHTIGEIVVSADQVTSSYYNRDEATRLAKIKDTNGNIYHRMGDLGYLDELGRLWFCGRKSQRVITSGTTLFTIPCEAVFNTHPLVFRSALVGVTQHGQTRPVICIELEPLTHDPDYETIKNELFATGAQFEHTALITDILFHPGFPVDIRHNAKIGRESLAVWAARELA